jgi:hypothetical protein
MDNTANIFAKPTTSGAVVPVQNDSVQTAAPTSGASNNSPSFWDRMLPTAGGILGGIGGGILGTIAAPFTGGIINPIDASVVGAGLGGAAGRAGENDLTGKKVFQGNDVTSGLENAGGQLLGAGAGSVLGSVFGSVSDVAGKGAVDALMGQAPGLLDRDTATYLVNNGITDLSKISDIAPQVTGAAGGEGAAFTNGVQNAVDNPDAGLVSVRSTLTKLQDPMSVSTMDPATQKSAANAFQSSFENMTKASGGDIDKIPTFGSSGRPLQDTLSTYTNASQPDEMTRGAVYDEAKSFQKAASKMAANAPKDQFGNIADVQQAAKINAFKTWGDELESNALGLGERDEPLAITDADRATLKVGISGIKKTNPSLYETLSNNIDSANNWKDIRSAQSPLVKASQAYDAISGKLNSIPGTTPLETASGGKAGILKSIVGSPTVKKAETSALSKISNVTAGGSLKDILTGANGGGSVLQKVLAGGGGAVGTTIANAPNDIAPPVSGSLLNSAVTGNNTSGASGTGATTNTATPINMFQSLVPGSGVSSQYAPIALEALSGMYDPAVMSNFVGPAQTAYQNIQKAQNAAAMLSSTYGPGGEMQQAGGAQGPLSGALSRLGALFTGGPAANMPSQTSAIANALTAAGIPTTPGQLPQITQNGQTASDTISRLQSLLQALGVNVNNPSASTSSLGALGLGT